MGGLITPSVFFLFLPPSPAARPENSKVTREPLHQRAPRPAVVRPSASALPPPCPVFFFSCRAINAKTIPCT